MIKKEKPGYHEAEVIKSFILLEKDYKNEPETWNTIKGLFCFSPEDKVSMIKVNISSVEYFVDDTKKENEL